MERFPAGSMSSGSIVVPVGTEKVFATPPIVQASVAGAVAVMLGTTGMERFVKVSVPFPVLDFVVSLCFRLYGSALTDTVIWQYPLNK